MARKLSQPLSQPLLAAVIATCALVFVSACGPGEPETPVAADPATFEWPSGPRPVVTLVVAGYGEIEIELYPEIAPKTVENFLALAGSGYYDGTTFHRVIPDFMVQGGDPNSRDKDPKNDGDGGPDHTIPDEFGDAPHARGAVSMANTGRPNSGGSQFFIVHQDAFALDGKHAVFGRVTRGMDVVDRVTEVEVDLHGRWGKRHRPLENVVIERATVREGVSSDRVAIN